MSTAKKGSRRVAPRNNPEAEAFRLLAERYDAMPIVARNPLYLCDVARGHSADGYDAALEIPYARQMCDRIREHMSDNQYTAYGEYNMDDDAARVAAMRRNKSARVLACLWMALEAAEEGR